MQLTLDEIYRLLLNSLKTEPEAWKDDNGYPIGEKPGEVYWIQNEDLGLCIWVANRIYALRVSRLQKSNLGSFNLNMRGQDLPKLSWWRRRNLYKAYKKLKKLHSKKTFDVDVSKKYARKYKINSIFEEKDN